MKTKAVPSGWLEFDGRRLDCGPYMSGALEAKVLLERLTVRKDALRDVTDQGITGIFNGPRFARSYVDDPAHGVPFLGSTDILKADLTHLPMLSRKQVAANPRFIVRAHWTLITCSGTIGRMAYARSEMDGMAGSQHFMRVVPDPEKIPPGYLYAYLSSKFGVPLVVGGTYGSIIQQIEPEHIVNLPVPRLSSTLEAKVHSLAEKAARGLSDYSRLCSRATDDLLSWVGTTDVLPQRWLDDRRSIGWSEDQIGTETFRSMNYDPRAKDLWRIFERANGAPLGSLCQPEYFKGKNIFKRIDAEPEFGVMLLGQRNAFRFRPEGRWISRTSVERQGLHVPALTTLIPSHGTLGEHELYCRALIVTPSMRDFVFSGDFFRCVPDEAKVHPGYLFAFLRSNAAFRMLRSISIGGKQQEQHPSLMWRLPVPRLSAEREQKIADQIEKAVAAYDDAVSADKHARALVEEAIEEEAS
ncbi:methylation-associated defense system restriction endonuclease subunit S MAD5 [Bradyrhizobium diazoefficiens]|uniref:Restriction endonuclease subunit S n=1 Tax=Bradyrhizobium diazoefficiens TaxID=1355477 RepID=A0A809YAR5_9BRAD|nr:restriction endonuclease subunit S [Bradyrhizobium diazoefficiens]BBZ99841.1 hypothetical protein H12S4_07460 [Bradyrhizobium diazoefficiens]BCA17526.1 hypothetical protein BDHH15_07410 [Bradyrhizobium diazoefficiens]BCE35710.1 hypothetical protein XF3B_07410 [Bradyrhizobium diazoefficiens]BCF49103.1 hypothetical protein XF17B_07410 [Bradyrhizobium diazoefficiens]